MSQITRCPACATTFKVVADQLRISDGWVRCGHCKEVFDASEHLLPSPSEPPPVSDAADQAAHTPDANAETSAPMSATPAVLGTEPVAADDVADDGGDEDSPAESSSPTREAVSELPAVSGREPQEPPGYELPGAQQADSTWPQDAMDDVRAEPETDDGDEVPAPRQRAEESPAASDEPMEQAVLQELEAVAQEPIPVEEAAVMPVAALMGAAPTDVAAVSAEPGFVIAARRGAFWRRPLVRGLLVCAGMGLMLGLAVQVAWQERDVIAARSPAAYVWMEQLCQPLRCTLQPPRRIDALVIDSSSFLKVRDDAAAYQLQVAIRNTSSMTVATPALELTLTDAQDQALLRRVLLREELGAPAQLAQGATWSGAVPMQVTQDASRVAGYRLLAFYP